MKKIILVLTAFLASCSLVFGHVFGNAAKHRIVVDKPAPGFFEGALLGNGGMGVVVTTRPDAVCLHFGHNNVWDIRIAENNKEKIGTFDEILSKVKKLSLDLHTIYDSPEFAEYLNMTADNYRKPYPRPFPCGTVLLGFDRRTTELLGHELDIATGKCIVKLLCGDKHLFLNIFTDMDSDDVWMSLVDDGGKPVASCFNRVHILPDSSTPGDIPPYKIGEKDDFSLGFTQCLPYQEPYLYDMQKGHPKDKAFSLRFCTNQTLQKGKRTITLGIEEDLGVLERYLKTSDTPFLARISLCEGLADSVNVCKALPKPSTLGLQDVQRRSGQHWKEYWACSSVSLSDEYLEEIWYRNLYFYNCAVKAGVTCPGLFANWSLGDIGTSWHGDYHLNYNVQQPFWLPFSSNHLDKNQAFVDLVYHLLPVSEQWASEYYHMRGAFFPHSAFPVDMTMHPYPVPDWGWEVFETPWMVQGLWWHYLYSGDVGFLRERGFYPIKQAVSFLVDYMTRPDGYNERWGDGNYHIFPSVPPELYGLQPGFNYNYDTQIDLTMARFAFKAYLEAVKVLKVDKKEKALVKQVQTILKNMPEYPTYNSAEQGEIYVSVPGEKDKIVYNVPANLTHVFPGEDLGMDAPEPQRTLLRNTYASHQNEGGNDIVFSAMQGARLGMLDLEKFKRYVRYATLPNQTVTDMVTQIGGRYNDRTDFAYMAPMGIWFENFALPAVINECLMQSHNGVISLFPNWNMEKDATFTSLRARGAFLVDAVLAGGKITSVKIKSERGGICCLKNRWKTSTANIYQGNKRNLLGQEDVINISMKPGETIEIKSID